MARVLVVDDVALYRQKLKQILQKEGHEIVGQATNGIQASTQYKKLQPDLVTMDILMEGSDGFDGIARIRENDPNAKILIVSSTSEKSKVLKALELGAYAYLLKPFEASKVISVLSNMGFKSLDEDELKLRSEMETLKKRKNIADEGFKGLNRS